MSCQKNCYNKIKSKISCPDNTRNNTPMVFNNQTDVYSNNKPRNTSKNAKEVTNGRGIYWGDTEDFCKSLVEPISVKIRYCDKYKTNDSGQFIITDKNAISDKIIKLTVNSAIKNKVISIFKDIYNERADIFTTNGHFIFIGDVGSFCYRGIKDKNGNEKTIEVNGKSYLNLSNHSYGIAIDICQCWANPYGKLKYKNNTDIHIVNNNHPVVQIFKKHGFGWGGSYEDYMHFSYLNGN